jgi:tripartite-type tricarboxylate transporter receptor subunit TctC
VTKSEALPDVPAAIEFVAGYEAGSWFGIGAPKGTPDAVVDNLNMKVQAAFADPSISSRISALGASAMPGSPSQFGKFIGQETEKYAGVIRSAKIRAK